jgi:hypothetical protein
MPRVGFSFGELRDITVRCIVSESPLLIPLNNLKGSPSIAATNSIHLFPSYFIFRVLIFRQKPFSSHPITSLHTYTSRLASLNGAVLLQRLGHSVARECEFPYFKTSTSDSVPVVKKPQLRRFRGDRATHAPTACQRDTQQHPHTMIFGLGQGTSMPTSPSKRTFL